MARIIYKSGKELMLGDYINIADYVNNLNVYNYGKDSLQRRT